MSGTVLALGGGGFTMGRGDPVLDELVLELAGGPAPRILFLPTAGGDAAAQIAAFYGAFSDRPCRPRVLSLFRLHGTSASVRELVLEQDVIYVGGGSMRNLLAIWRAHGLDEILRAAWERGIVLAGLSAGAMCWFEGGITMSGGPPEVIDGLGFLPGSLSVHLTSEPERAPAFRDAVRRGDLPAGWALDDGAGLLFEDGRLTRAVRARPEARAVRVEPDAEHELDCELLTAPSPRAPRPLPDDVRELRALRYGATRRTA